MKETVYLTVSRSGVGAAVRKNLPTNLNRGEIPVRVTVNVSEKAFMPPVLEQSITIEDPYKGIDLEDVHFNGTIITETEAEVIRKRRLRKAAEILRANNYNVEEPEEENDAKMA